MEYTMTKQEKEELLKALKIVDKFVGVVPGGCTYWLDLQDKPHTADMGYVCEFLEDAIEYFEQEVNE